MTVNPVEVMEDMHAAAGLLDTLSKQLDQAITQVDRTEKAWDEAYDQAADQLEEDWPTDRKSTPPEHLIVSTARRVHREEYAAWRAAKRRQALIETQINAAQSRLKGRRETLVALREEDRAVGAPAGPTFGRAA